MSPITTNREECEHCQALINEYSKENLEICEFCGHFFVQNKTDTGFCTCPKGLERKVIIDKEYAMKVESNYTKLNRAKEIIASYVKCNLEYDMNVLGGEAFYDGCDCTIKKIQKAFDLLNKQYNFFN